MKYMVYSLLLRSQTQAPHTLYYKDFSAGRHWHKCQFVMRSMGEIQ